MSTKNFKQIDSVLDLGDFFKSAPEGLEENRL